MAKRRYFGVFFDKVLVLVSIVIVLASVGLLAGAEEKAESGPERNIARVLRHISADQGKKYLTDLGLGTVSQLGKSNMLLVTGRQLELLKAKAVLSLVDSQLQYVVKTISAASGAEELPGNDVIAAELGDVSIGTFLDPPSTSEKTAVIIDIHNESVVALVPTDKAEKLAAAIEQLQRAKAAAAPGAADPNQAPEAKAGAKAAEADDIFDRLLDSIPDAMEVMGGSKPPPAEPNTPAAGATTPQADEPNEPSLEVKAREETVVSAGKEPKPAATVTEAKPAATEPPAEKPTPKPATGPTTVERPRPEKIEKRPGERKAYTPKPAPDADDELMIELPEKLPITTLIELVGKYLHLDYMYDPAKIKGEVMIKIQKEGLKISELYPTLESVLKFKSFVMTRKDNLVLIVPKEEAWNIDPEILSEDGQVEQGDVIVTRFFTLEHISAESAKNLLTNMALGASITPIEETGTLIVAEYAFRMERIDRLLKSVDVPGQPKEFRYRVLTYTMAETLAPKVKTLAEQLGTISVSIAQAPATTAAAASKARGRPTARPRPTTKRTTTQPESDEQEVYLEADERTNRILMIGLPEQLELVDELIDSLDVEKQDLRALRLYDIQNVDAEEVMTKLFDLGIISSGPTTTGTTSARRTTTTAKGQSTSTQRPSSSTALEAPTDEPQVVVVEATNSLLVNATAEQHVQIATIIGYVDQETLQVSIPYVIYALENQKPEELVAVLNQLIQESTKDQTGKIEKVVKKQEDIIIVGDEKSSSVIVYASKKNQEWVSKLIRELDKRRPQVLIDVTLVEVSKSDTFEYDLSAISSIPNLMNTSGLISPLMGIADSNGISNLVSKLTSSGRDRFIDFGSTPGSGGVGFYGDTHINALLKLMQTKDYGRILAKPKILVNDNEAGTIKTTDTVYVKRVSQTGRVGATTSTGVGSDFFNQSVQFDPYDAGITLEITPHISEGELLRLEVTLSRSDFKFSAGDEEKPPNTTASDITTVVTVPDGSTIILGGMVKLNQGKGGSKIPIVGDIPIIGGLFRTINNTDTQNKLYVFVKAEILRPSDTLAGLPDLNRISATNRIAFEEFERQFQEHEDWPGIKPDPMDPLKVLDAR